jgi:exonuclease SbcC
MRLRSLSLRGLTRFQDRVDLDLDAAGPGLVAIVGSNGEGKSTLMEAAPAALWKTLPTRPGSLYDHAHGRDAFVEATFACDDGDLVARLSVDADARKTEGYLFLSGAPLAGPNAEAYAAEVERRAGSLGLFLAGPFACQSKRGSFLDATRGERKALFAELLGLGRLEDLAQEARARGAAAERDLDVARALQGAMHRELAPLPSLVEEMAGAEQAEATAALVVEAARERHAAAAAALERARGAGERIAALQQAELAARHALQQSERRHAEVADRPRKAQARAAERTRAVDARKLEEMQPAARRRHAGAVDGIERRRGALEAQIAEAPELERVAADLQAARESMTAAVERNRQVELARALERDAQALDRQAARLGEVPCTAAPAWSEAIAMDAIAEGAPHRDLAGTCPLLADARAARDRAAEIRGAIGTVDDPADVAPLQQAVDMLVAAMARADAAAGARQQLAALGAERAAADEQLAAEVAQATQAAAAAAGERRTIAEDLEAEILDADAAIREASGEIEAARARYRAAEADLRAAQAEADPGGIAAATGAESQAAAAWRLATEAARVAGDRRAALAARVDALRAREADLEAATARIAAAEADLGDWRLLDVALGKNGVQALEVDAAAPEIAGLVNELLASCYGPRFSLRLETLREKKSSPGDYSEVFDVTVYDGGTPRLVEALSGGERVIVGEAVGLALAIHHARRNAVKWATLWRDETAGALDPANAGAYVRMLRRAREMGGFHQVLFVAHQPEVWEAADARIVVAGGRATVEAGAAA